MSKSAKTTMTSTLAAAALVAALGLGASGAAQAHDDDVSWSINMYSPGMSVGVSNMQAPPAPVYVQPRVVYSPPVVYYPQPAYRVIYPGHAWHDHGRHYGHGWGRHRGWEGRGYERRDHDGRGHEYRGHEQRRGYGGGDREMHIGRH